MTRMTGPDCAAMGNLIHTHTHTHTQTIKTTETITRSTDVSLLPRWLSLSKKSKDQPGKVANPARGQLNREN